MLSEMCPDVEASFCFPQKYRTPNGECNNVKHPMWGVTGAAYLRLQEPQYEDGVRTPRNMGVSGTTKLPDALTVSSKLIWTKNDPHEHLTALAAVWGQFVAHDISYTLPLSGYEKVSNVKNQNCSFNFGTIISNQKTSGHDLGYNSYLKNYFSVL